MTWAEYRINVNQIKSHPFFYGADWNTLRQIEPPFVPRLSSLTDTSYFPTDEFGDVPNQPGDVEGVSAEKDLAFLGFVLLQVLLDVVELFLQIHIQTRTAGRIIFDLQCFQCLYNTQHQCIEQVPE